MNKLFLLPLILIGIPGGCNESNKNNEGFHFLWESLLPQTEGEFTYAFDYVGNLTDEYDLSWTEDEVPLEFLEINEPNTPASGLFRIEGYSKHVDTIITPCASIDTDKLIVEHNGKNAEISYISETFVPGEGVVNCLMIFVWNE